MVPSSFHLGVQVPTVGCEIDGVSRIDHLGTMTESLKTASRVVSEKRSGFRKAAT